MGFVVDLENKVRDYLSGDYEISESTTVPSVENVAFGKKSKKLMLCAYSIDLRKSSNLLLVHQKQTAGKIHKAFLTVASKVVLKYGGEIRSFQGDSLLAFWPALKMSQIQSAVRAAMVTKWLLNEKFSPLFERYEKLDFGIGVDWGKVFIVRVGISRNSNNNDLVFIGKCVNFAVAIANQAKGPNHVEISTLTHHNLDENLKYSTKNNTKIDIWKEGTVVWNEVKYKTKCTSYHIPL